MNADDWRRLYDSHFAAGHRLWAECIAPLMAEQFRRPVAHWDTVEAGTRAVLADLREEDLRRSITDTRLAWQVLWHVLSHGTDHRAQTMAILADLGAKTFPQDYALFAQGKW